MKRFAKIVVFLVMLALVSSALGAQSFVLYAQLQERPAGCHEHGGQAPESDSKGYQCCLTGHNIAIPQTPQTTEPIFHNIQSEFLIDSPIGSPATGDLRQLIVSSGDPPGVTALRI